MQSQDKVSSEPAKSNWWEGYIIRYSLGTLVGSLICWFLVSNLAETSQVRLFVFSKETVVNYVIIAFMGLTFCYIASAPMLVLHVSRYQERKKSIGRCFDKVVFFVFGGWVALAGGVLYFCGYFDTELTGHQFKLMSILGVIVFFLIVVQIGAQPKSEDDIVHLFDFYAKLTFLRFYTFSDIMTSYRHIREHGNAYSVLLLELLLGFTLWLALKLHIYLVPIVVVAWVFPAAYSWQVGTNIEKMYIKKHYETAVKKHRHTIRNLRVRKSGRPYYFPSRR
ncbi:hypothetical protein JD974_03055 [Chromobacterium haemolyticum]|uniref:Uncharacterized protein n=1 Tax=Chromobacterium haemolyticum TaxID=394935 RepID=A0ABS3GHF6_9NEIS|nr:hypothetical protein [Chromobacterium haemolyticum]MBK0413375.1 hypothetical protein [Chromobacterium haemolyticum]MBO0414477.1 hypothetical protein [Chromobacterium haemolyticum]MBO0497664.1 hypothetical protein [Chromobacterium haemolyticum]